MVKIIELKTSDIKDYENNPRNNDAAVDKVSESIKEFGFKNPIIVDNNNVIVCGHTRKKAAEKLGIEVVPCIIADDLTEDQIKAFRLVDNKTAEYAEWDFSKLEEELKNIEMDLSNYDFSELESQIEDLKEKELVQDEPPLPDEGNEPITKFGDIWQLGNHRLMCGDSTNKDSILKLMNNQKADLVFTDPPYGMKKENEGVLNDNLNFDDLLEFNKKWIPLSLKCLKIMVVGIVSELMNH